MTRAEHLIENALIAVSRGKNADEFKDTELTYGGNTPSQLLDMVYEMAMYVHYTWNEGMTANCGIDEIKEGDRFVYRGIEYICLEVFGKEVYGNKAAFAVTAEIIKTMEFAEKYEDGCNNWKTSKVRDWLNDEFLSMHVSKEDLIPQTSDLTADNGDDAYGTCEDYVTLLSCDQYRKYRKMMPKYDDWVWTVTPWACHTGNANNVRLISPSGALNNRYATGSNGVAPVCLFNLDNLNLHRQVQLVHEDKPENEDIDDCEEE